MPRINWTCPPTNPPPACSFLARKKKKLGGGGAPPPPPPPTLSLSGRPDGFRLVRQEHLPDHRALLHRDHPGHQSPGQR